MTNDGLKPAKERVKCLSLQMSVRLLFIVYVERSTDAAANEKAREKRERERRQLYCDAHSAFNEGDGGRGCRRRGKQGIFFFLKGEGRKQNVPIGNTGDGALLELHHVAGQGPRLVRENVFHLYG